LDPASNIAAKSYGLHDPVNPAKVNTVISMEEIEADQKSWPPLLFQILNGREDGKAAIQDAAVSYRTKLRRLKDCGKKGQKASDKHFCKQFIVCIKQCNGAKLGGGGHTGYFIGSSLTTPRRNEGDNKPSCSIVLKACSKPGPTNSNTAAYSS
jgi:hypothetical protein